MSYHSGPDHTVPENQRCEALVVGDLNAYYEWQRRDRQCCRRAQQARDGIAVCYSHSIAKTVQKFGDHK